MTTPKPGKPVRGSRTGRPIMALLDLLGRRWTLRILWELREESCGFRALQDRCDSMSPSVLSQRLMELQEAGIVEQNEDADYTMRGSECSEGLISEPYLPPPACRLISPVTAVKMRNCSILSKSTLLILPKRK